MGVHGLWELLAPVGRRVSVETLAGKKLAIDASIWMVQFIKAMRDDRGEMVRNAHIIGFFRRICKLLFLRTKPVFVFDGATPALKRRTLITRRRQRENAQAKVRKTAEKLLLNHLKTMRLKELAEDVKNQKQQRKQDVPKKKTLPNHNKLVDGTSTSESIKSVPNSGSHESLDGMLAESIMAEENVFFSSSTSSFAGGTLAKEDNGEQSILNQKKDDSKGKKILSDEIHVVGCDSERMEVALRRAHQQNLDEMLAASIAAEEAGSLNENVSVSAAANLDGEDTDDEDEEMVLPEMLGVVDPSVLAALPPSVQLDLLVQMRERLMAENRQKYQRVKKDPAKFSELQIQAYLKTVAFRRDIDQVQKAAAGRGVGGVQTSRIASEANREFIFSSSFTGDKQALASTRAEKNGDKDEAPRVQQPLSSLNITEIPSTSNALARSTPHESEVLEDNIETFLDERGRVRVSRVRAMGMHMTRDYERNLDLMKEIEKNATNRAANPEPMQNIEICNPESFSFQSQILDTSDEGVGESINKLNERGAESMLNEDTAIEILLEDEGGKSFDGDGGDDDLFTHLAAENPIQMASFDISSQKLTHDGTTDSGWEEGLEGNVHSPKNVEVDGEGRVSDESEVDWEDGVFGHVNPIPFETEPEKAVSKGSLEEEAYLQEAIRRSLEDTGDRKSGPVSSELQQPQPVIVGKMVEQCMTVQNENVIGLENPDSADGMNCSNSNDSTRTKGMAESSSQEKHCSEPVVLDTKTHTIAAQLDASYKDATFSVKESNENNDTLKLLSRDPSGTIQVGDGINNTVIEPPCRMVEMEGIYTPDVDSSKALACKNQFKQNLPVDKHNSDLLLEEKDAKIPAVEEISNAEIEVTVDELTDKISALEQERLNLGEEQKRLERNAESVSSEMFAECQELLQMFGLPYIIAPMEAEAQCAYMELANLVDGVVTDDSDVFLFGARSVYKNIFDDRKYVETYFMKDVENELGLNRDKLIRMALLLGSDYTEGISGIGIVNAVEVMNAFPEEDGLHKFKEWIESPDPSILGTLGAKTGSSARKRQRGSKASENGLTSSNSSVRDGSASEENIDKDLKENIDVKQRFMDKHRNVSKNWHIPSDFPSEAVISAYICPQLDKSAEPFSWGKPDHFVLRRLCWEKLGWDNSKADELLLPVLKEYGKHETQLRLEAFYTFNERFAKIRSKRIKKAVKSITGSKSAVLMDDAVRDVSVNYQRELSVEPQENMLEKCSSEIQGACSNEDDRENRLRKPSRKRQLDEEKSKPAKDQKLTMKEKGKRSRSEGSYSERGRGKGRGRGRGRMASKGKTPITELIETSSSGDECEFDDLKFNLENLEEPQERRRSSRIRKSVSYTMDDADQEQPSDHNGERFSNDEAREDNVVRGQYLHPVTVMSQSDNADFEISRRTLQRDYLDVGGGFCPVEEDERNQEEMCQNKDSSLEANNNEDYYLKVGGGFCFDDDNECVDPIAHPDQETVLDVPKNGSKDDPDQSTLHPEKYLGGDQNKDDTDAVSNPNSSQVGEEGVQVEPKDHSISAFGGALSAMPNLRRKRRKY